MSTTDLAVLSAGEIESQLLSEAQQAISDAQVRVMNDDLEKKIDQHYEQKARKLMERIWKDCKKRTDHRYKEKSDRYSSDRRTCSTCHYPERKNIDDKWKYDSTTADAGIAKLGTQLRNADAEAGIEWIP